MPFKTSKYETLTFSSQDFVTFFHLEICLWTYQFGLVWLLVLVLCLRIIFSTPIYFSNPYVCFSYGYVLKFKYLLSQNLEVLHWVRQGYSVIRWSPSCLSTIYSIIHLCPISLKCKLYNKLSSSRYLDLFFCLFYPVDLPISSCTIIKFILLSQLYKMFWYLVSLGSPPSLPLFLLIYCSTLTFQMPLWL